MAEPDQDSDSRERRPQGAIQPSQRLAREMEIARHGRRRKLTPARHPGQRAPCDEHDNHHRGNRHDSKSVRAGLVKASDVPPPEIRRDREGDERSRRVVGHLSGEPEPRQEIVHQTGDVLPRRHAADGSGEDVIEQQRGDGELGQRSSHRLLDHTIDAATDEHGRALDIDGANRVRKEHHAQNEPRRGLAHRLFGNPAHVVGRRAKIVQHDRRGSPEGDEREKDRRRKNDANTWLGAGYLVSGHAQNPKSGVTCGVPRTAAECP